MRKQRRVFLTVALLLSLLLAHGVYATGEINVVRAPEEIPQGDDITVVVSASARESDIQRSVVLDFPESWKFKRAWKVEAGSDQAVKLPRATDIAGLFVKEKDRTVLALADNSPDFDPDAEGIAYFVVFSTKSLPGTSPSQSVSVKAALVERTDPDAPTQLDPKTKRPLPRMIDWRMTFPPKFDFSFNTITTKRLVASVRMDRVQKASRAVIAQGTTHAEAELHTRPEILHDFFQRPFSIQFWLRTTAYDENIFRLKSGDGREVVIGIGILGQPRVFQKGAQARSFLSTRSLLNDGAWHNVVVSKDSLSKLRLFVDAQPPSTVDISPQIFQDIGGIAIGDSSSNVKDFSLDELRLVRTAYRDPSEYDRTMAAAMRDTAHTALAIFHFEDFGAAARSSVLAVENPKQAEPIPMFFALDSDVTIAETTSPVQLDQVMLTADLASSTHIAVAWKTTSEIGVKQYRLERRVGTFGPFEKVLVLDAKHGVKTPKRGQPIVSRGAYSVSEELPKLNGDIDLYYRVAVLGFNEKDPPVYSLPVKVEYGTDRDVFVEQNDPNPFNPTTVIAFRLTKPEAVRLSVFDIIGREVTVLANAKLDAGKHIYTLDATNWPAGIYFYKVKTPTITVTRKMVLVK